MGYRSEVKIVAGKKPATEIRKVLKKYDGSPLSEIGTNERGDTLFSAEWVKWYTDDDCFPDVDAIMKIIDKYESLPSDKRSNDTGIEYCRVGEDDSDTEYRANGDGYGYLSVSIRVDGENGFTSKPKAKSKPKATSK